MAFGILVIGSELLTGKRRDAHLDFAIAALEHRGLELAWCRYVADDPPLLVRELRHTIPELRPSCLPHMDGDYRETELGVRGPAAAVAEAMAWLEAALDGEGLRFVRAARSGLAAAPAGREGEG